MFSRMNRVKNDWRNRLSRERLEHNLRIGEDGPTNKDFDSKTSISRWNNEMKKFGELLPRNHTTIQRSAEN